MATDSGRKDMRTRTIVAFLVLVGMAAVGAVQAEAVDHARAADQPGHDPDSRTR